MLNARKTAIKRKKNSLYHQIAYLLTLKEQIKGTWKLKGVGRWGRKGTKVSGAGT